MVVSHRKGPGKLQTFQEVRNTKKRQLIGAGDLGGTKLNFGVFELRDGELKLLRFVPIGWKKEWEGGNCGDAHQLLALLARKLAEERQGESFQISDFSAFVLAAAGECRDGVVLLSKYPNGEFRIVEALGEYKFKGESLLFNDFVAQARAAASPIAARRRVVVPGKAFEEDDGEPAWAEAVGAGTGFGVGPFRWMGTPSGRIFEFKRSEGGNCPVMLDRIDQRAGVNNGKPGIEILPYLKFVERKCLKDEDCGQSRAEILVSGRGLCLAWEWTRRLGLHDGPKCTDAAEIAEQIRPKKPNDLSKLHPALVLFSFLYGQLVRASALWQTPHAGIFVTGGVAQESPFLVCNAAFRQGFGMFGVQEKALSHIPVWLLLCKRAGLWGAAYLAADALA